MRYAQLGSTDLLVSRICFGCWQLSPAFWGDVALEPWHDALKAALDCGVNFIDTADAYGDGYAEESLGEYLATQRLRDRFTVATKFYWNIAADERHPDTRYEYILQACEASLKRLRTDRIDLYQIHAFDPLTIPEEVGAALGRLKKEGKVRWFGVSNLNAEQMRMYGTSFEVSSLQPPYSLLARDCERNELPYCRAQRIGVIPYSPLYRGLLSGKYGRDHTFTDSRAGARYFSGGQFKAIMDGLDELRPIAGDLGLDLAQLAIRWVATHPAVTAPIVGIKTPEHITGIVKAVEQPLPAELWHRVAGVVGAAQQKADRMND
jgi:myo-inositol catabolism protein IolS